jgi:hypothetical protein
LLQRRFLHCDLCNPLMWICDESCANICGISAASRSRIVQPRCRRRARSSTPMQTVEPNDARFQ